MPTEQRTNYLAKLLTLLVKRDNGIIRIPIQDLMTDDVGQGIQVHFDQSSKELVISHVPAGSTIYRIEGAVTWLTNDLIPKPLPSPRSPLSHDDQVARAWTESAATPTLDELSNQRPSKPRVVVLTSEGMAEAEDAKLRQRVLREIENYQSPQPPVTIPSRQTVRFSKP